MKIVDWRKLKKFRKPLMTMEELGKKTGIGVGSIKNFESGRRPCSLEHLYLICEALDVSPDAFMKNDTKVITVLSNKGGSTKTTTAANLAYTLASNYDKKILLIDTDLQQNLSQHYGMEPDHEKNFAAAFMKEESIENHIKQTHFHQNIDIVISDDGLSVLETEIVNMKLREHRMQEILKDVIEKGEYDYIIIDCNPSLNLLNRSILFASDHLIVPVDVNSSFGVTGMEYILRFYKEVAEDKLKIFGRKLNILGILMNRYTNQIVVKTNTVLINEIVAEYLYDKKTKNKQYVFETIIPQDAKINTSQSEECPVGYFDAKCRSAQAFIALGEEVITYVEEAK